MSEPPRADTPFTRIKEMLDRRLAGVSKVIGDQFARFKKTRYPAPVAIGITALVLYLTMVYMSTCCFLGLIPPVVLFVLLWQFDIRRVRKMLLYGLVCTLVIMAVSTVYIVNDAMALETVVARSAGDDPVLVNGTLDPTTGGKTTLFTFNITVVLDDPGVNVTDVRVNITSFEYARNETMRHVGGNATLNETYYECVTTLSASINQFHFVALVNGTWVRAGDFIDGEFVNVVGPIFSDPWEVAKPIIWYITMPQAFFQFLPIYAILCGMVWWMRRSRRMREDAIKRYEEKRKEMEAKVPVDKKKVAASTSTTPSLERALGLEPEPETFVCSDCGADVPAEAKTCPVCGEKFE
jgi:hypothetical protein